MTSTLAIDGGSPVRADMLPYGRQTIDDKDIEAVTHVLRSDWLTSGPEVAAFEEEFAAEVGAKYAVAVSSGTAALHAAAYAAELCAGDSAIVPPMTFAASANCIRYQDAEVIFADVQPGCLNLDPSAVRRALRPHTKAIVTVAYAGQPSDLDELLDIAHENGLILIDDAAHALGAVYRGRREGSIADLTTFSLHPVKHVTTGEGGVVTTNDAALYKRLRKFRNHGISSDHRDREAAGSWFYEMVDLGYNYRINDFQCALGRSQLKKLAIGIERRQEIAMRYAAAFADMPEIDLPEISADRRSAWHLYPIQLKLERLWTDRAGIFRALRTENIGVNVHYIPVPWHPYYRNMGFKKGNWPIAESAYERLLSLPIFPAMSDSDVLDVINAVAKVTRHFRQ